VSEGFVGRWTRLKAEDRRRKQGSAAPELPTEPTAPLPAAAPQADQAPDPTAALPPVESLTKDSNYAAFLKEGVPEGLKNAALRQLWRSDPVLAAPELLDLHNLDYTFPKVPEVVQTAYQVGKGYFDAVAEAEEKVRQSGIVSDGPRELAKTDEDSNSDDSSESSIRT
jgi:hypothetical protein